MTAVGSLLQGRAYLPGQEVACLKLDRYTHGTEVVGSLHLTRNSSRKHHIAGVPVGAGLNPEPGWSLR